MLNWRKWCRLCGDFEVSDKVEPEIAAIAEQVFDIPAATSFICLDCNAYVRDFQSFLFKSKMISGMFEELEQKRNAGDSSEDSVLQIRQFFGLPLPVIEVIETLDSDIADDLAEIDCYNIGDENEQSEEDNVEYVFDEPEVEQSENQDQNENEIFSKQDFFEGKSFEDAIVDYSDGNEFMFEETTIVEDSENQPGASKEKIESDDISSHFDFRCHICGDEFNKMCFLSIHTKTVHECHPQVICICGKPLGTSTALEFHYNNHVRNMPHFRCHHCNKFYKTEANYRNHMLTYHSQEGDEDDGNARKFQCDCGKSFKEARHLAVHANSHLPDVLKFVHVCSYCEKRYSSVFSLRQHIKHIHVNVPTYKCTLCDKMFSRKANLDSHLSHVHTAARNYECDLCGLKVKTKGILRVHKKIHSTNPDDLLTCDVCQRQFKTTNQLTNHKICHSNDKRFKCTLCPNEYKRSKELTCHIASLHTGEVKYSCLWCPKTFYNNSNFRKHKLKIHRSELEQQELKMSNDDEAFDI